MSDDFICGSFVGMGIMAILVIIAVLILRREGKL